MMKCEICDLPVCSYTYKHNGETKTGYRCIQIHSLYTPWGTQKKFTQSKVRGRDKMLKAMKRLD